MLVCLIGPSGAGKSTIAAGVVLQRPDISHVDLDAVIRAKDCQLFCHNGDRWDEFWTLAAGCIKEIDQGFSGITLIDCGAGCLQTDRALSFFQSEHSAVAFIGSPTILFDRAKKSKPYWKDRTLLDYQKSEFSDRNKRFYDAARFKLDVSKLSGQEAVIRLLAILKELGGRVS